MADNSSFKNIVSQSITPGIKNCGGGFGHNGVNGTEASVVRAVHIGVNLRAHEGQKRELLHGVGDVQKLWELVEELELGEQLHGGRLGEVELRSGVGVDGSGVRGNLDTDSGEETAVAEQGIDGDGLRVADDESLGVFVPRHNRGVVAASMPNGGIEGSAHRGRDGALRGITGEHSLDGFLRRARRVLQSELCAGALDGADFGPSDHQHQRSGGCIKDVRDRKASRGLGFKGTAGAGETRDEEGNVFLGESAGGVVGGRSVKVFGVTHEDRRLGLNLEEKCNRKRTRQTGRPRHKNTNHPKKDSAEKTQNRMVDEKVNPHTRFVQ